MKIGFIEFFVGVTIYGFVLLFVCVGVGLYIGGDEGGAAGCLLAIIVAGISGYVVGPHLS